jgi:hypothetical protein
MDVRMRCPCRCRAVRRWEGSGTTDAGARCGVKRADETGFPHYRFCAARRSIDAVLGPWLRGAID